MKYGEYCAHEEQIMSIADGPANGERSIPDHGVAFGLVTGIMRPRGFSRL